MPQGESSTVIAKRVLQARHIAQQRANKLNADLSVQDLDKWIKLDSQSSKLMNHAMQRLGLSARSYHRILRIAQTIADLANQEQLNASHISEALALRMLERRMKHLGNA